MFFTAFLPPLSITRQAERLGDFQQNPVRSFVWWKDKNYAVEDYLSLSLAGTELFQLTKCFMALKYDDTAR